MGPLQGTSSHIVPCSVRRLSMLVMREQSGVTNQQMPPWNRRLADFRHCCSFEAAKMVQIVSLPRDLVNPVGQKSSRRLSRFHFPYMPLFMRPFTAADEVLSSLYSYILWLVCNRGSQTLLSYCMYPLLDLTSCLHTATNMHFIL